MPCAGMPASRACRHTTSPVCWLIAITVESRSPANSSPSPMPMPRLPPNGVSGLNVQSDFPVAGSSARICPAVVVTNMRPSLTSSGAFDVCRSGRSATHAPPSVFTFAASICASVE